MSTQMGVARSWHESREECRAGAGYLVSLGNHTEEEQVRHIDCTINLLPIHTTK